MPFPPFLLLWLYHNLLAVTVLKVEGVNSASVKVTLNPLCHHNAAYTVQVFFGIRQQGSDEKCVPQQNMTADIVPGESVILAVEANTLTLDPGQEYCSPNASLIGEISGVNIWKRIFMDGMYSSNEKANVVEMIALH